ncbi:membrane protein [Candidatus Magnetomorum sp. HK-1]|nr:membrane protein [Candidatus Magnetomorum sp. HK-1]
MYYYLYGAICLLIGLLGANRKFGFWGYFFGSILLSPIIGLCLVLASDKRNPKYD